MCRADRYRNTKSNSKYDTKRGRNRVKKTLEHESESEDSSDEDFLSQSVAHMNIKRIKKTIQFRKDCSTHDQ